MPDLNLNYAPAPPWLKNDAQESNFLRDMETGQRISQNRQMNPLHVKEAQNIIDSQILQNTHRQLDIDAQRIAAADAAAYKEASIGAATVMALQDWVKNPDEALDAVYQWVDGNVKNPFAAEKITKAAESRYQMGALVEQRRANAAYLRQRPVIEGNKITANAPVVSARAALLQGQLTALEQGKQVRPTDFEANINFINKQLEEAGHEPLSNSEFMDMAQRHMGVLPRASAAGQWFDKAEVNSLVKEHGELQKEINELQTSVPPRTKAQREQRAQSIAAKFARQVEIGKAIEEKRTKVQESLKGAVRPEDTPAIEFKDAEEVREAYRKGFFGTGEDGKKEALRILEEQFNIK